MRTTHPARARALATLAAASLVALGACGTTPAPEPADGPVVLTSSGTSATPTPSVTPSPGSTPGAEAVVPDVRDAAAELEVEDQSGDGSIVTVAEVVLSTGPGHVVVVDPSTRAVLGSAFVRAGTSRAVTVTLTTPVPRSGEYVALLHADDGDGRFDEARDAQVVEGDDDGGDDDSGDDGGVVDEDFRYTLR